jgi:type III pantothenate kinase
MSEKKSDMVIDIGNTRMKVALFVRDELDGVLSFSNRSHKKVAQLVENAHPKRGILSNVSKLSRPLTEFFEDNANMLKFDKTTAIPIELDYKTPESLGTDRVANAVAAHKLHPGKNVLIIDFGTCLKYDIVTAEGMFKGGAIAPGIQMRFKAMHKKTGNLPRIKSWEPNEQEWPGKDTRSCMVSGVIQGIHSEILRYIDMASERYNNLTVISTGGDYALFDKVFKNIIFANPYLTLQGLHEILRFNND